MNNEEQSLWKKIKSFVIGDESSQYSFIDRLARENSWTHEYSIRVVFEYKRFIFLICVSRHPLTPSDQVDQVWHLHLIYTQSYWTDLCKNTINQNIHHGPTRGGGDEKNKFENWYEKTKLLYEEYFNEKPPADIWPSSSIRFGLIHFTRVNRQQKWVIPKPKFLHKWKY